VRFLVDQNLSPLVAEGLVAAGHDAVHTDALGLARASDAIILQRAETENRVVVSADTDFGDLLVLHASRKPSIILLRRPVERRADQVVALLVANIPAVEEDLESGAIVVLDSDRVRSRRLPIT
jgi:predicted nuclease of predicted toxin-antitoxin system